MDDASPTPTRGLRRPAVSDPLIGAWILIVGGDSLTAMRLRGRLAGAGCEAVELAGDDEEAAERAAAARPDALLALSGTGPAVRRRLDPLGLEAGPPVVALDEIPGLPAGELGDEAILDRLGLVLERHRLRQRVRDVEAMLTSEALSRHRELEAVQLDALRRIAITAAYRDDNTWEHTERVAATAARLARRLGLDDRSVELMRHAAPLHDVGKIAIPDSILLKPGQLTDDEFEVVKTHASVGEAILSGGDSELFRMAAEIAGTHHERWDGSGYPAGLRGDDIPMSGRVVAVADTFDILVHERPWKEGWTVDEAAAELARSAGTHFDPEVVAAFEDLGAATLHALSDQI